MIKITDEVHKMLEQMGTKSETFSGRYFEIFRILQNKCQEMKTVYVYQR
jgi:hypothetical protein